MTCERCGCTDERACVDAHGEPCAWVLPGVCSSCATDDECARFVAGDYDHLFDSDDDTGNECPRCGFDPCACLGGPRTAVPILYDAYGVPIR